MQILIRILPYIQIVLSVLLVATVLLQQSDASFGSTFGGDDTASVQHTRRGAERFFFNATIILGILFTVAAFVALYIDVVAR